MPGTDPADIISIFLFLVLPLVLVIAVRIKKPGIPVVGVVLSLMHPFGQFYCGNILVGFLCFLLVVAVILALNMLLQSFLGFFAAQAFSAWLIHFRLTRPAKAQKPE